MSKHHKSTRSDRAAKAAYKAECAAADEPCWMCGMAIDYDAPFDDYRNPDRFERDHYYPAADFPDLYFDPANWRPSHAGCNLARSNGQPVVTLGSTSRDWSKI